MPEIRSVVVERDVPHAPEKIWRALTQPHLIEEWLMKNDFAPVTGHRFSLRVDPQPHWDGVIACEVRIVEPNKTLYYTWAALGLDSVVTRSDEHTSELQSLLSISYAVFCLKKKKHKL